MPAARLLSLLAAATLARGLNNGVGELPEMGFNSWYALHPNLVSGSASTRCAPTPRIGL